MKKIFMDAIIGIAGFVLLAFMTAIMLVDVITSVANLWGIVAIVALAGLSICWSISWIVMIKAKLRKENV